MSSSSPYTCFESLTKWLIVLAGTQVNVTGPLGSYDVYGVPSADFTLDGIVNGTYEAPVVPPGEFIAGVVYYQSAPLSPGNHTLVITNLNGTFPTEFWLDSIVYVPSADPVTSAPTSNSASSTSSSASNAPQSTSNTPSTRSDTSAIAGGAVGGGAGAVLLALFLFFFLRRWTRNRRASTKRHAALDVDAGLPYSPGFR